MVVFAMRGGSISSCWGIVGATVGLIFDEDTWLFIHVVLGYCSTFTLCRYNYLNMKPVNFI